VSTSGEPVDGLCPRDLELVLVDLVLRRPTAAADRVHHDRPVLYVRVLTESSEGWGEAGALPGGTAVDPDLDTVLAELAERSGPRLLAAARRGAVASWRVPGLGGGSAPARLAGAALEMALLDAELRSAGRSLADHLGTAGAAVAAGALVGLPADGRTETLVSAVGSLVDQGYRRVRVKIAPGFDRTPLAALRAAFPGLLLQADANGAYTLGGDGVEDAARLGALDDLGLTCLEQPLAPADLVGHAELAERLATPVALDESLSSVARVGHALRYRAMGVACLKPARLGGLGPARRALSLCREAGVPAFVGGLFESGRGRAANLALAGLEGFSLPGDLSPPASYLEGDPFAYPALGADGTVRPPDHPGVGPLPSDEVLVRRVRWRRRVEGPGPGARGP
jgi:O-succinylbenzoate synthase